MVRLEKLGLNLIFQIQVISVKMNEKDLKEIIEKGENKMIEFKESLSLKESICETISAFSNTNEGFIFVGVSDKGEIIGSQVGEKTIEQLANFIKQNTDNPVYPDIDIIKVNEKNIIIIKINESFEKPVFYKNNAYKRVGKSTHKLSASEIRRLSKENNKIYWDEQICKGATLNDIDGEKIKLFLEKAGYERKSNTDSDILIKDSLEKLKLIKHERLTNASILLFGKDISNFFTNFEIRCAKFKGIEPIEFIDMKLFKGDILNQREEAINFIKEHIRLHAKIIDTERVETWEYPIEAIREAVTNAICHRTYEIAANIQIRIFDDRIEIWNPGGLTEGLTIEKLKTKHESIPRNPLIAKNLFLIKYIEQWGTGTNRIIKECLNNDLPEPIFEDTGSSFVITIKKYRINNEIILGLNERQKKAIDYLIKNKKITNKDYVSLNPSITDRTALNDFNELIEKNIILSYGERKYRYYTLR